MSKELLISIVLPTYNRGHLISETIQSVLNQKYSNWELIIIDDGSTDNSRGTINKFNDQRIQYYAIDHCGILGKVRNTGLRYCKGDYIAFLDSDDIWLPNKLNFQLSLLEKYPQAAFAFGHGEQFGDSPILPPHLEPLFVGNVFLPMLLNERFVFYVPTIIFKKEILNETMAIDESLKSGGDIDFFLRMAHSHDGIFSNEIVVRIRKHQHSHSHDLELTAHHEYLEMIYRFLKNDFLTKRQYKQIASKQHYKLGLLYFNYSQPKKAAHYFLRYALAKPMDYKGWARFFQASVSRL
jgi:glycosyltransferase involved in cell wall biosynthesis